MADVPTNQDLKVIPRECALLDKRETAVLESEEGEEVYGNLVCLPYVPTPYNSDKSFSFIAQRRWHGPE